MEQFFDRTAWQAIVPSPFARALCLPRQHFRKTVSSGEDNNIIIRQVLRPKVMNKTRYDNRVRTGHPFMVAIT